MEASGRRQATKAGSIHAWVAHSKYGGNDDFNAVGTGIMIFLARHCHSDAPCLFISSINVFSGIRKAVFRELVAAVVAILSHVHSCIIRVSSTFMVARLQCIIVSCGVDRNWASRSMRMKTRAYKSVRAQMRLPFAEIIRH